MDTVNNLFDAQKAAQMKDLDPMFEVRFKIDSLKWKISDFPIDVEGHFTLDILNHDYVKTTIDFDILPTELSDSEYFAELDAAKNARGGNEISCILNHYCPIRVGISYPTCISASSANTGGGEEP
ncbi:MAG: hypothetical protein GY861_28155 [bacterium]|nr:hypothetical protein [bacterium]